MQKPSAPAENPVGQPFPGTQKKKREARDSKKGKCSPKAFLRDSYHFLKAVFLFQELERLASIELLSIKRLRRPLKGCSKVRTLRGANVADSMPLQSGF